MADAIASSVIDALTALEIGAVGDGASNRFSFDGVTLRSSAGGALEIGVRSFEAASLRLESGPLVLEIGRFVLRDLVAQLRVDEGAPRLRLVEAADAELSDVTIHGPLSFSRDSNVEAGSRSISDAAAGPAAEAWSLGPLAAADGTIRAQIVDAHLLFDADVTVPIRRGRIDFNEVTVEHVGPDSSMGISRLGLYVDAPNGRSYIYQFSSTPISGVEFEQRNKWLGAWVANRGNLQLQGFSEGMMRQAPSGTGVGFTEEARLLFDRTAVSGDVQLSDGRFSAPGLKADLVGRVEGRNAVRLRSKAVGRGLTVEMPSLSVRHAALNAGDTQLACDAITGALVLRVQLERAHARFAIDVPKIRISGLRIQPDAAKSE